MTDDMPEGDLPYLEMLYKFVYGKNSHYDLAMTRMVEPQADIERMSEEEGTTDRHDMREMERGAKTLACDVPSRGRSSSSGKRKTTLASIALHPCSGSATNPKMGRIFI